MSLRLRPFRGWTARVHDVLESTNAEARRLVTLDDQAAPFFVWTDRQTRGRGRGSNSWWSDAGSLTVTCVVDPLAEGFDPGTEPLATLTAAVALCTVIEPWIGGTCEIRWPNDVEVAGRKIAGFLTERVEGAAGPRLLVGMGLNVATQLDDAPPEVRRMSTSMAELAPAFHQRRGRRGRLYALAAFLDAWGGRATGPALNDAVNRRDGLAARHVRIVQGERIVEGIGRGINADGSLRVENADGPVAIYGGQVLRD